MPGTPLNLDLPLLSDTMSVLAAKTAAALDAIQNDLAPLITSAEINVNAPLSLGGNALTEATSLQLSAGDVVNATPGTIFYYSGEFWMVDAAGTPIQITANGLVNIGGTGGFNGDYVASNPTGASYDLASGQFRFTKSAGVWADMSFANAVLNNSGTGSVSIGVDSAITTGRTINVKALPVAGVSGLVYSGSTSTIEDSAVTRETNTHLFTAINASGTATVNVLSATAITASTTVVATGDVTAADLHHTAEWEIQVPYFPLMAAGNIQLPNISTVIQHLKSSNVSWDWYGCPIQGLRVGDHLKRLTMKIVTHGTSTVVVNVWRAVAGSLTLVSMDTWNVAPGSAGTFTHTFGSPITVGTGQSFFLEVNGSATGEEISPISLFVDHP